MGVDDGMPIYYSLTEIQVRGTDRLHRTHEHENVDSDRKKMEQYNEEPGESECWTDDPYGH